MPRKRDIPDLADSLRGAAPSMEGTTFESFIRERYAHQAPAWAVAQFERDVTDFAKLLVDNNLVFWGDLKGSLVWCMDDLLTTYRKT
jgi:hypothetical protein